MTENLTKETLPLNSELTYAPEDRYTVDELISKKAKKDTDIVQLNREEFNHIIEKTITCHQALDIAESNVREVMTDYVEKDEKVVQAGFKLLTEPFIPEDAGFKYEGSESGGALFSKGRFAIASTNEEWIFFGLKDTTLHLRLDNMFQAIQTLSALGVDITTEEVLNS